MNEATQVTVDPVLNKVKPWASLYFYYYCCNRIAQYFTKLHTYITEANIYLDTIVNMAFPGVLSIFTSFYRLLAILASRANTNYIGGKKPLAT